MVSSNEYSIPILLKPCIQEGMIVVRAPGRINLIGEHTDYNEGFVLPGAIDKAVYVAARKNQTGYLNLYSTEYNESVEIRLDEIKPMPGHWATYILGVVSELKKRGHVTGGVTMNICGDIPLGAGLSSSAAIECAVAYSLNELFELNIDRMELAKIAQAAEHEYAGVQCGIMDQFASLFGKENHLIRLDCRSLQFEYIPFETGAYELVLFDTKVKHTLATTEYNTRRRECGESVHEIRRLYPHVQSLRDVTMEMIEKCLEPQGVGYRRSRYVTEENARLLEGCGDLVQGDLTAFGKKMFATHEGLRNLYEVSCPELDFLVDTVKNLPGVIGARMMGGGFGGCTINLVKKSEVDMIRNIVGKSYFAATGVILTDYIVRVTTGTSVLDQ